MPRGRPGSRWWPLAVLVVAGALLLGSVGWAATRSWDGPGWGVGPFGSGMAGQPGWFSGEGPVDDLDAARGAADRFADRWGLEVGEVMEFERQFYAELVDPAGDPATEVLVDRGSGAVRLEFGPAMMWNTAYGMHSGRRVGTDTEDAAVGPEEARAIADRWLADHRSGETSGEAEPFPGYYTLHTEAGGEVTGMLSVHSTTGAVWFHSWHGDFVAMDEGHGHEDP